MEEKNVIDYILSYYDSHNKLPSFKCFCDDNEIKKDNLPSWFCWDSLVYKTGLKSKSSRRDDNELLLWVKTHPKTKYNDIPNGIRRALELRFGSVTEARKLAGLNVSDFRKVIKRKKTVGRPLEFTQEIIINGLQDLAAKLGKPPKMKDISKKSCGFPLSAVICRFGSFNNALQAADLPPIFSHNEFKKLEDDFNVLLLNHKLSNDPPVYYKYNGERFVNFLYKDRCEFVKLTRSDIQKSINSYNKGDIIYYLVDDSLFETTDITLINVMDSIDLIQNSYIKSKLLDLRNRFDEINRKYIIQI